MDENIGKKFGSYTIIDVSPDVYKDGHKLYVAQCSCGKIRTSTISSFKQLKVQSCTHRIMINDIPCEYMKFTDKRIAQIFYGIINRCYNTNNKDYHLYGGKGVYVYDQWIIHPDLFERWCYENGYNDNLTIDRIDENDGYTPFNCRLVTLEENARFKSTTNYITANVTLSGKQWASLIPSVSINAINRMVKRDGMEKTVEFIEDKLCNKHDIHNRRKRKHAKFYYMHGKFYEDPTQ